MRNILSIILFVMLLAACSPDNPIKKEIPDAWEVGELDKDGAYPATVPGCVHLDLMENNIIDDPFYGDNEYKLQWIGETSWEYNTSFRTGEDIMEKDHIEMVFEGLDTYAEVWLNDNRIITADNMFRSWQADVKDLLDTSENRLKVVFYSPLTINNNKATQLPYTLPDNRAFTRKSPYHFGWDWGPEFVSCGIWKPLYIRAWDKFRIARVHVDYASIDEDPLPIFVHLTIESDRTQTVRLRLFDDERSERLAYEKVKLEQGTNTVILQASIEDPELWWPAGLGGQKIYSLHASVSGGGYMDEATASFGIRQIELIREPDQYGESFFFVVNGLPVFMKGANYVPQDNFLPRVDTARYEKLIGSVQEAGMNMLRVWGGGFYENDIFYDLCDKYGILVWQDFMFACTMYPGDEAFLENVRQEAIDNVSRLSNHPCIAMWCGNNEIDEGWHNWGWQEQLGYSEEDSAKIWNDYLNIFHKILPGIVEACDPGTVYWPSSPMTGWGREEAYTRGDVHYWGVWWGEEPFSRYREKVGRFISEYGFQAMPHIETIRSFGGLGNEPASNAQARTPGVEELWETMNWKITDSSGYPLSHILEAHQKHPRGTELIQKYMEREFIIPEKFEDYVYISQVLQAEGMGQAYITHRISQPYCMGTLYWQLNDCWPVTSWAGLDYYGRWKALHYHVKRAYAPLMLGSIRDDNGLHVFAVNDRTAGAELRLQCRLTDFYGNIVSQDDKLLDLPPQSNQRVYLLEDLPEVANDKLFTARLLLGDSVVSQCFHYFVPTKNMLLTDPGLTFHIEETGTGPLLILKTKKLARQVFLDAADLCGRFEDNFFDMAAGEERRLHFYGTASPDELNEKLTIKTIYETY